MTAPKTILFWSQSKYKIWSFHSRGREQESTTFCRKHAQALHCLTLWAEEVLFAPVTKEPSIRATENTFKLTARWGLDTFKTNTHYFTRTEAPTTNSPLAFQKKQQP